MISNSVWFVNPGLGGGLNGGYKKLKDADLFDFVSE
jgi:hypothetical protein